MVDERKLDLVKGDAAWLPVDPLPFIDYPFERYYYAQRDLDSAPRVLADVSNQLRMPTAIG
jgi:hypothetical protein